MERMIKDFNDGDQYMFANSVEEYDAFVSWLCSKGWEFSYHFETGEGFKLQKENGSIKVVEVYGL